MTNTEFEINRLINNRFFDGEHPFRHGHAGMEAFARLTGLLSQKNADDVARLLPRLDELLEKIKGCDACYAKLCAFAWTFCTGKLPLAAERYAALYEARMKGLSQSRQSRDFHAEVKESINQDRRRVAGEAPGE